MSPPMRAERGARLDLGADVDEGRHHVGGGRGSQQPARRQHVVGVGQRPEQTVVDAAEEAWADAHGERVSRRPRRLPDGEAAGVLVDLCRDTIPVERDDLAGEPGRTDFDELVAHRVVQPFDVDDGSVDASDAARTAQRGVAGAGDSGVGAFRQLHDSATSCSIAAKARVASASRP